MMSTGLNIHTKKHDMNKQQSSRRENKLSLLIHIPHGGEKLNEAQIKDFSINEKELMHYVYIMRDTGAMEIAEDFEDCIFKSDISRLWCDVERYIGPEEIMEKYGMGYCYEKAYDGTVIKVLSKDILSRTRSFYDEYHKALNDTVMKNRNLLFIDLHTFSKELVMPDFIKGPMPDICIGTDDTYTSSAITNAVIKTCEAYGYSHDINYPYSGTMVPSAVKECDSTYNFTSVMIEVNKSLFMNADGSLDNAKLMNLQNFFMDTVHSIAGLDEDMILCPFKRPAYITDEFTL